MAIIQCASYNETLCSKDSKLCEETVINCNEANNNQVKHCYVLWQNTSSGIKVNSKGCWIGGSEYSCADIDDCIERNPLQKKGMYFCCCSQQLCNQQFYYQPSIVNITTSSSLQMGPVFWPQLALIVFIPSLIILSFLTFLFFIYKYKKFRNFDEIRDEEERVPIHDTSACNINKPIRTIELIAKGRFSTVWKAKIENNDTKNEDEWVAVKVFSSQEKDLALFEQEVFQLPQMKNENISTFLGCFAHYDESGNEISSYTPEYWLVTEYHELGSLYDYLKANTVNYSEMLKICEGIAKGLTHLHEEIPATKTEGCKPAIAHRDFKSRNVLLKSDLTPLITDFGLCLIFYPDRIPNGLGQVGTRRYMAPEVLEGAINFSRDSLIRIDIYALALVMWEVLYRCREKDKSIEADEYILPFQKEVGHYPTIEDMQEVVCQQKKRPEIKEAWRNNSGMNQIAETIEECWDQDADARLSASCVVERLSSLIKLKNMVII